ncbi:uncharacterized protein PRCAT00005724001 [Priceomyces carsonii]|uniref:uncharacterized protein n=1 Tax=Priceomyces carsonii TaxID=28549 RepID=UPI002ED90E29|nr:unnamed protein product [Priceomyces carsonii]
MLKTKFGIAYQRVNKHLLRPFTWSAPTRDLFGGTKNLNKVKFEPPSGKGETSANPVDLLKKNDILMFSTKPVNYIESVKHNGYHLANRILIRSPDKDGNIIGALLIDSESFEVNLTAGFKLINRFIIEFNEEEILLIFRKVHPKPEILVVGLGKQSRMLSESNRRFISKMGIQIEASDSNNAAQIFDLLSTERPGVIAALLLPPNV